MARFNKLANLTVIFIGAAIMTAVLFFIYPNFFLKKKNFEAIKEKTADVSIMPKVYFPGRELEIKVELADTPYLWSKGLMSQEFLEKDSGMLFIFPNEGTRSFWMKNTKIPLDIIFISKEKKVVDIKENFQPCAENILVCPNYFSKKPAMYALEVNAGMADNYGVEIGDNVDL